MARSAIAAGSSRSTRAAAARAKASRPSPTPSGWPTSTRSDSGSAPRIYNHDYDPAAVEARAAATPYRFETHNFAFGQNLPAYDVKDRLGTISCPTLVVVGRSDPITPVRCSEAIAALIPGARLEIF